MHDQLTELNLSPEEKAIAEEIIGNINEKGYWDATLEGVAERLETSTDAVDDILDTIQRLDPPGIAARDLKKSVFKSAQGSRAKKRDRGTNRRNSNERTRD